LCGGGGEAATTTTHYHLHSQLTFTFTFTLPFTLGSNLKLSAYCLVIVWFQFGSCLVSVWLLFHKKNAADRKLAHDVFILLPVQQLPIGLPLGQSIDSWYFYLPGAVIK